MEPLTPNDPLWKVLGRAKNVEPRPNFTQNVVRLARQTPQEKGWLARVGGWWQEMRGERMAPAHWLWSGAAAAVVVVSALWVAGVVEKRSLQEAPARVALSAPAPIQMEASSVATQSGGSAEADFPLMPEFVTEWQNLEQMGDLLAVHEASVLTDSEIGMLLY